MSMMRSMSASELAPDCDPMEGVAPVDDESKAQNVYIDSTPVKAQTLDRFARPSFLNHGEKRKKNFFASFRFSKKTFNRSKDDVESSSTDNSNQNLNAKEEDKDKILVPKPRKPYLYRVSSFVNRVASRVQANSDGNSPSFHGSKLERSQTIVGNELVPKYVEYLQFNGTSPALMGIRNHGNTCFINAVIQCLSHTDILAEYFVLDQYKADLARSNRVNSKKFGTKGEITEQLAVLLKSLWILRYSSDISLNFKNVVEKFEPIYVGSNQHDAAEFLMFVLDKVHEDLNTASKRKYRKVKSSYGRPDDVVAAETLANHLRCNDSFVQAIFQAQFRSSLKCPHCLKESNTFDPYLFVSIPIPQKEILCLFITVVYLNQQPKQVKLGISIDSNATIKELRSALSNDCGIDEKDLVLTEIDGEGFHRTFADNGCVNMIKSSDPVYAIELNPASLESQDTAGFLLITWFNIVTTESDSCVVRFGGVYQSQIARDISYPDLQKLLLKEMCSMVTTKTLLSSQQKGIFDILVSTGSQDMTPLSADIELPLFDESVEEALSICHPSAGNPHVKLVLKWDPENKQKYIIDDVDHIDEHASVQELQENPPQPPPVSLNACLQLHTSIEMLSCGDAWLCPTCNRKQQVLKRLTLWSAPQILVLHLKRFKQNSLNANSCKLTTRVDFPLSNFDISEHMSTNAQCVNGHQENQPQINYNKSFSGVWSPWKRSKKGQTSSTGTVYDLYAVCNHHGKDVQGGHYTATCRNPINNKWYKFDDFKFEETPVEDVVTADAYILFYQKREDSLPAPIKEVEDNLHWSFRIPLNSIPTSLKMSPTQNVITENNEKIEECVQEDAIDETDCAEVEPVPSLPEVITSNPCQPEKKEINEILPTTVTTETEEDSMSSSPPLTISNNKILTNGDSREFSSSAPEPRCLSNGGGSPKLSDGTRDPPTRRQESTPEVRIQPASEEVTRVYRSKAIKARKAESRPNSTASAEFAVTEARTGRPCDNLPITTQSEVNGFTHLVTTNVKNCTNIIGEPDVTHTQKLITRFSEGRVESKVPQLVTESSV